MLNEVGDCCPARRSISPPTGNLLDVVEILTCTPDLLARFAWQIALASEASARQVHVSPLRGSHRPDVLRENDMLGLFRHSLRLLAIEFLSHGLIQTPAAWHGVTDF